MEESPNWDDWVQALMSWSCGSRLSDDEVGAIHQMFLDELNDEADFIIEEFLLHLVSPVSEVSCFLFGRDKCSSSHDSDDTGVTDAVQVQPESTHHVHWWDGWTNEEILAEETVEFSFQNEEDASQGEEDAIWTQESKDDDEPEEEAEEKVENQEAEIMVYGNPLFEQEIELVYDNPLFMSKGFGIAADEEDVGYVSFLTPDEYINGFSKEIDAIPMVQVAYATEKAEANEINTEEKPSEPKDREKVVPAKEVPQPEKKAFHLFQNEGVSIQIGTKHLDVSKAVRGIADKVLALHTPFVRDLEWDTATESLKSLFGELEEGAVIMNKNTGKSKGYGCMTVSQLASTADVSARKIYVPIDMRAKDLDEKLKCGTRGVGGYVPNTQMEKAAELFCMPEKRNVQIARVCDEEHHGLHSPLMPRNVSFKSRKDRENAAELDTYASVGNMMPKEKSLNSVKGMGFTELRAMEEAQLGRADPTKEPPLVNAREEAYDRDSKSDESRNGNQLWMRSKKDCWWRQESMCCYDYIFCVDFPKDVSVTAVCPKGLGPSVRRLYVQEPNLIA